MALEVVKVYPIVTVYPAILLDNGLTLEEPPPVALTLVANGIAGGHLKFPAEFCIPTLLF
jgi:hypothetical protein